MSETKICTKCKKEYPKTVEYFHRQGKYLKSRCKTCYNQQQRKEYRENHEAKLEAAKIRNKRNYWNNVEENRAKRRQYYYNNRIQRLNYAKQYRLKHLEAIRKKNKQWDYANRDKTRVYSLNYHARKQKAKGVHTAEDIRYLYTEQKETCFWCGERLDTHETGYHVDHVHPLALGGWNSPDNLVIACPLCNATKGSKPLERWLHEIGWV